MGETGLLRGGDNSPLGHRVAAMERILVGMSVQNVRLMGLDGNIRWAAVVGKVGGIVANTIALGVHSRSAAGLLYVGIGPFGNLWDAKVSGELTVVPITGRLADPADPADSGWRSIGAGETLYLVCEIEEGDITNASLETGDSSTLCQFSDYTQVLFRVPLARIETLAGSAVVLPLRSGELVADFTIIDGKLAKYVR